MEIFKKCINYLAGGGHNRKESDSLYDKKIYKTCIQMIDESHVEESLQINVKCINFFFKNLKVKKTFAMKKLSKKLKRVQYKYSRRLFCLKQVGGVTF